MSRLKERSRARGKTGQGRFEVGSSNFYSSSLFVFIICIYVRCWVGSLVTLWHFIHFNKFVDYYWGVEKPLTSPTLRIICYFLIWFTSCEMLKFKFRLWIMNQTSMRFSVLREKINFKILYIFRVQVYYTSQHSLWVISAAFYLYSIKITQ